MNRSVANLSVEPARLYLGHVLNKFSLKPSFI